VFDKEKESMNLEFTDGVKISITDEGQSCCESRYMTCDDEPSELNGQKLIHIITKDGPQPEKSEDDWGDVHDIAFLEIQGDKSSITFATHNQHNGYYGGFGLNISESK
jgi:hypothetical protein